MESLKRIKKIIFLLQKKVELDDLTQYVLDDIDKWIIGHQGDTPGKYERELMDDVAHGIYNELKILRLPY